MLRFRRVLLILAFCGTTACATTRPLDGIEGQVLSRQIVVIQGDEFVRFTIGWRDRPDFYIQLDAVYPRDSREAMAFHVGGCALVVKGRFEKSGQQHIRFLPCDL